MNEIVGSQNNVPATYSPESFWGSVNFPIKEETSFIGKGSSNSKAVMEHPHLVGHIFCTKTKKVFASPGQRLVFIVMGMKNMLKTEVYAGLPGQVKLGSTDPLYVKRGEIGNERHGGYTKFDGEQISGCNLTIHRRPELMFAIYPLSNIGDGRIGVEEEPSVLSFGMNQASECGELILSHWKTLMQSKKLPFELMFSLQLVSYTSTVSKGSYQDLGSLKVQPNLKDGKYMVMPPHGSDKVLQQVKDIFSRLEYERGDLNALIRGQTPQAPVASPEVPQAPPVVQQAPPEVPQAPQAPVQAPPVAEKTVQRNEQGLVETVEKRPPIFKQDEAVKPPDFNPNDLFS